jgi:hypothetical protein
MDDALLLSIDYFLAMATIITISAHTAAAAHGVTINTQVGSTSNQQVRQLIKRTLLAVN